MSLQVNEPITFKGIALNDYYIRFDVTLLKNGKIISFECYPFSDKPAFQEDENKNILGNTFKVSIPYNVSNDPFIFHRLHLFLIDTIRRDIAYAAKVDKTVADPANDPIEGTKWTNSHGITDVANVTLSDVDLDPNI
jgi:hypothetical protein